MTIISRQDLDGIAVLVWDQPDSPVNACHQQAIAELVAVMTAALEDAAISGVVLSSAKKSFVAGGDLRELQATTEIEAVQALVKDAVALKRFIEKAGKPVVAAVNGATLGGGFELALACHARVAAKDALIGLPEVNLGLMPGAGGTQRLPRLIGLTQALPMLTSGRPVRADKALELGIVDQVVDKDALVASAVALARTVSAVQPWDKDECQGVVDLTDAELEVLSAAEKKCQSRSGEMDIAEQRIIDTVRAGLAVTFDKALAIEAQAFCSLPISKQAKNRMRTMFFAMNDANAIRCRPKDVPKYELQSIAVVGAGTMGGGIAFTAASRGLQVVLIEVNDESLSRGMAMIEATADRQVKAGRMAQAKRDEIVARIKPQVGYDNLTEVDAAIEAVIEVEKVKAQVFQALEGAMKPGAPIASNTSTLPITRLASYCQQPENFLGAHFFGPVERMPLVEVIRGEKTSDTTLARCLDLLKVMKKTPIVVNDGLGFYTSRVVASYTGEALTMLAEGIDPVLIDKAATEFGMVIGPCTMADMTGLPLLIDIFNSALSDKSRHITIGNRAIEALEKLVAAGRKGRREGAGIYAYDDRGKAIPWTEFGQLFVAEAAEPSIDIVKQRLMHAQALETVRAMEDGVVTSAADADVGSVIGWMFPKGYGGVLSYVDTFGAALFVQQCDHLCAQYGERFTVPARLRDMAATNETFHLI